LSDATNGWYGDETYQIGEWVANATRCTLSRNGTTTKVSPRSMSVLVYLAERASTTVPHDELLKALWPRSSNSPNGLHKCISELREVLGDVRQDATYIETVPTRGYRLVAAVASLEATAEGVIVSFGTRTALVKPVDTRRLTHSATTFVEGIHREFMVQLGQISNASIRSQKMSSVQAKRPQLAAELSVDYVVDFDVHEIDGQMRASVALLPTSNELPSHHEQLDTSVSIAEKVTHALEDLALLMDVDQVKRMREWGTKNVHAYRHALEAELLRNNINVVSFRKAEVCLDGALAEDPSFGFAYELQTCTYYDLGMMAKGAASYERTRQSVRALLEKGRLARIDGKYIAQMEQTYRVLCLTNPVDAEMFWREELVRNANNPDALRRYADLLAGAGLADESERYLAIAISLAGEAERDWYEMDYLNLAWLRRDYEEHLRLSKKILDRFGDYTVTLQGLVETLAYRGRFTEAEFYLSRLNSSDRKGGWAYSAKLRLMAFRGEIPMGSDALKSALADPLANNLSRGITSFIVGDVENGVRYWRDIEPSTLELIWRFKALMENHFAAGVTEDIRYQALLDEMMIGRAWPLRLLNGVKELEPFTGIAATTHIATSINGVRNRA
jgi:DNA-binding winged helix-turn-helix (wHTH) protein/tetratricopeptide (TPR) repeat protein